MIEKVETIIIGCGQASLAVSYFLKQAGQEHLIIDAAEKAAHIAAQISG
jgi:cation diffusion facilitator CzcD-associated flavoprotein CzcO